MSSGGGGEGKIRQESDITDVVEGGPVPVESIENTQQCDCLQRCVGDCDEGGQAVGQ